MTKCYFIGLYSDAASIVVKKGAATVKLFQL